MQKDKFIHFHYLNAVRNHSKEQRFARGHSIQIKSDIQAQPFSKDIQKQVEIKIRFQVQFLNQDVEKQILW